ncbi:hypothetical protein JWS92_002668 [Enterococcus faecalis]|nr:hypothetical protein [Enterococcus faecalis]
MEPINTPQLFNVKVADKITGDNQYLTPYSQTQTIVQQQGLVEEPKVEEDKGLVENSQVTKEQKYVLNKSTDNMKKFPQTGEYRLKYAGIFGMLCILICSVVFLKKFL